MAVSQNSQSIMSTSMELVVHTHYAQGQLQRLQAEVNRVSELLDGLLSNARILTEEIQDGISNMHISLRPINGEEEE